MKKIKIFCPMCGSLLFKICKRCKGVILICPVCESSVLIDYELGCTRISALTKNKLIEKNGDVK